MNKKQSDKIQNYNFLSTLVGVACFFVATISAQAELVYETPALKQSEQRSDRKESSAALDSSEAESSTLSKAELLRRKRMRQELQNEDLLQSRIEELRLREEEERTRALTESVHSQSVVPMQEENVGSDSIGSSQASALQSTAGTRAVTSPSSKRFLISPRFGVANMGGNNNVEINSRFATGVTIGVLASHQFTVEIGYTYAEYGMSLLSSSNTVRFIEQFNSNLNLNRQNLVMKQNSIESMVKMNLLDPNTVIRPFVGAGAGYSKSFINYDNFILQNPLVQNISGLGADYELNQFSGSLATGFDLRISSAVSVGGILKYTKPFASNERAPLNNGIFFGGLENGVYDKSVLAGSAVTSHLVSFQGAVSLYF